MKHFFGVIYLAQLGMLIEPTRDQGPLFKVKFMAIHQQELPNRKRSAISSYFFSCACKRGIEKSDDVKLVSNNVCIWKKAMCKGPIGPTHIHGHKLYAVTAWDVPEQSFKLARGASFYDLEGSFVLAVIDDEGREAGSPCFFFASEAMFVDADLCRPAIDIMLCMSLKLLVERFIDEAVRATILLAHGLDIGKSLAGPDERAFESFREAASFADALNRFCEGSFAGLTREATLSDL